MAIMEKPLSFEDYKKLRLSNDQKAASYIIKRLNDAIKMKRRSAMNWSQDPERVSVLAIVAEEFKKVGWGGVIQKRNTTTQNYSLILIPPGCVCNCTDICQACKENKEL